MRKYLYLLAVLALAVFLAAPVSAAQEHPHSSAGHCVCGGAVAGHDCTTIKTWTPLSGQVNFGRLDSGNYYLIGDVTAVAADEEFVGRVTKNSDGSYTCTQVRDVTVCLNGYNITADSDRTFKGVTQGSSLTITDCSYHDGTWGGTVIGGTSANGGIIYTYAKSTLNIYGGNFTGKEGVTNTNGGLFVIAQDRGDVPSSTGAADQYSTFNLYNGHFYGGSAKNGGNLNFMHYVHANIYGGIIEGGTATSNGGNIQTGSTATLNIRGTKENPVVIRNGSAAIGGNVNINHSAANLKTKVSVSNAVISGGTASDHSGNLHLNGELDMPGVAMYDCAPEVAAVWNGSTLQGQYKTVAEAATKGGYVRMMADVTENATISEDLYIDLAGYDVSGLTCTGAIYGMDSLTDDYTDENAGTLTVNGNPQRSFKTESPVKRYLAVEENGSYSFHRYYVGVTTMVLRPAENGMGYKACFAGSETVKSQLKDFGMAVSFDPLAESLADSAYRIKAAERFAVGQPFYQKLVVQNILTRDSYENHDRATTDIYARCFIRLADGTVLFSNQVGGDLLELTEQVDAQWSSFTATQQQAVGAMITRFPLSISGWSVENAHHCDGMWQPWTGTWTNGGHYYLTEDSTISSTITVGYNQSLSICLNGCRLDGSISRLFKVYGTLNIHDHRNADGSYDGSLVSTHGDSVMAPVFYVYEHGTMNLCGGNLRYEGSGVMTRGGVGMVGGPDTADDSNTTLDPSFFNMYYGTISGGKVQAVLKSNGTVDSSKNGFGGNLDLVDRGVVNLYRGSVTGGTATQLQNSSNNGQGGNISVSSSKCELHLYDVEITGGSSGVYLNNGMVALNGGVQIRDNGEYNLYVPNGKTVQTGVLKDASVGITMGGSGSFTTVSHSAYADCFTSDVRNIWVINDGGSLSMGHGHCVCGASAVGVEDHKCEGLLYTALPATTDFSKLSSGHYYLSGDVTVTGNTNWTKKQDISICLNGYDIKTTTTSPFGKLMAGASLSICDCSGKQDENGTWSWDGTVYGGNKNYGGVVNFNANSHGYIYGGNFTGVEGGISGGVFNVCNDGYTSVSGLPAGSDQYDDIYDTHFTIYNGYVRGGNVTNQGGSINCWHHVDVFIYGGTITGGVAATHGGNISAASGTLTVKNAVISDGTSGGNAGNIYISDSSQAYFEGATVTGGTAAERGGNVYIAANANVYMDDAAVTDGTAKMGGGVFNYMATVHLSGNTRIVDNENYNLHQFLSKAAEVHSLDQTARIGVYSEVKGKLLNTDAYTDRFFSEDAAYELVRINGSTLYLPKGTSLNYAATNGFSAGYGEVDVSPTENGVPLGGYGTSSTRLSTEVDKNGRLYVMTTAVTDEEGNTILIVACDQIRFTDTVTTIIREHMSAATGVPAENIYINCSHSHSVPDPATTDDVSLRYRVMLYNGFVESGILAMQDRRAASMQIGSFEVTGKNGTGTLNYVRHYQHTDANGVVHYFGDNFGTAVYDSTTKHVSEADPTMFLIKFTRSGTDILLTNWRAHPHFTGGSAKTVVSSDYVGPYRDEAERLLNDTEVVFLQGAAGNINEKSRLSDNHGLDHIGYGKELAKQLSNNMGCLQTVPSGLVQTSQTKFTAKVDHSTDDRIEDAKLVNDTYWDLGTAERKALLEKYGFSSVYHAGSISARYSMAQTVIAEINVFSIGDQVGFFTVPGELWDSASVVVEEASPFPITVCVGYSLGDYKYFTYGSAWTYDSYESANYRLTVPDTLLYMIDVWTEGLEELYENAQ